MQTLMQLHLLQLTATSHNVQQSAAVKAGGGRLQRASATDAFTRSKVRAQVCHLLMLNRGLTSIQTKLTDESK